MAGAQDEALLGTGYARMTTAPLSSLDAPPRREAARARRTDFVKRLHRFAQCATPRLAIDAGPVQLDYGDLWRLSAKLCGELARGGAAPHDRMLIIATRSPELVATVVAALRSGVAFSIVDPRSPDPYIAQCCDAVRPDFIVDLAGRNPAVTAARKSRLAPFSIAELGALPDAEGWQADPLAPDDMATITFTSGTTRAPKAVAGRYGSLFHFFPWMDRQFGPLGDYRFGMCSSLAHDPLQRDLLTPLFFGAAICVPQSDITMPGYLPSWLADAKVAVVCLTPPLLAFITGREANLPDLKLAFFVGGSLARSQVKALRRVAPQARIVATYGATESQRAVGYFEVPADDTAIDALPEMVPIGRGMNDVDLVVCRPGGGVCRPFEVGEIAIRSRFIALGYLDDPALTAARFRTGVMGPADDEPAYLTGDLGYFSPEYGVVFSGRGDTQRKIDGHRVDLGQIAGMCREHALVADAAVVVDESAAPPALVAFLVPSDSAIRFDGGGFAEFLGQTLPRHMVPKRFETLASLPLTLNGKIDEAQLRCLAAQRGAASRSDASQDRIAEEVLGFIEAQTGIREPDPAAPLDALGIDSLRFLTLLANLRANFGVRPATPSLHNGLPLASLLDRLASSAGPEGGDDAAAPLPVRRGAAPYIRLAGDERQLINFCSNDYLGLAHHPAVIAALHEAAAADGVGASSSRLLSGYHPWQQQAEQRIAEFVGAETAVLFATGFLSVQAAVGWFFAGALPHRARILIDERSHAASQDAAARSGAAVDRYAHRDLDAVARALTDGSAGETLIVTDGIFSATGEVAPLRELAGLARKHGARLLVDDAHGIGALGRHGRGALELLEMATDEVDLLLGTCSKAFGSFGGFVAGRREAVERVIRAAPAYASSTAPPACLAAATLKSLDIAASEPWRRERIKERVGLFRSLAAAAKLPIGRSETMIQTIDLGCDGEPARLSAALLAEGIFLRTLPGARGHALRINVTAAHEPGHLERLVTGLARHLEQEPAR